MTEGFPADSQPPLTQEPAAPPAEPTPSFHDLTPPRPSEQGQSTVPAPEQPEVQPGSEEQPPAELPHEQPPTAEHQSVINIGEAIQRTTDMQDRAQEVISKGHQSTGEPSEGTLSLTAQDGWVKTELFISSQQQETLTASVNGGELRVSKEVRTDQNFRKIGVSLDQATGRISGDLATFDDQGKISGPVLPLTEKHISDVLNTVLGRLEEGVAARELHASDSLDRQVAEMLGIKIEA